MDFLVLIKKILHIKKKKNYTSRVTSLSNWHKHLSSNKLKKSGYAGKLKIINLRQIMRISIPHKHVLCKWCFMYFWKRFTVLLLNLGTFILPSFIPIVYAIRFLHMQCFDVIKLFVRQLYDNVRFPFFLMYLPIKVSKELTTGLIWE